MRSLLVTFLLTLLYNVSSAQSGWGYVNYTSYKTHGGVGDQSQYNAFANNAAGFDAMFNTANSNTTITHTGETQIVNLYNGSLNVPRWNSDYFGYKFEFWFVPQQTGLYYFGINSDDASDLFVDDVSLVTYYGGHGASSWQVVGMNMIAGKKYKMVYRGQEFGGGEAFYFKWYRPVGGWGYWNNEITNISDVPTKQAKMNFDFGSTLNKTTFSVGGTALSSTGLVDITNSLDSVKIGNGYKGTMTNGQVEWSYVTNWDATRMMLFVDLRTFDAFQPSTITSIKILDAYDGPVTYINTNTYWAVYSIPITTFTPGTYIRDMGAGSYAFKCDIVYTPNNVYKPQSVTVTTTNNLTTLYNSIITVSDVWLAFKEVANVGIFGNQSGNEFGYGIQYKNGDVNDDGIFNEQDTYRMLQHLTGVSSIVDAFTLSNTLKIIPTTNYNNIGKSNWNTSPSYLGNIIGFDINTGKAIDTFNYSATWKGDVNLSHSAIPASNGITNMSVSSMSLVSNTVSNQINAYLIGENIGGKLVVTVSVDPLQQEVVGTQFNINYDNTALKFEKVEFNTKGNPTNFGTDRGSYITVGSLITDGAAVLDKTTEYKITFLPLIGLNGILGLTSVSNTDAVNKDGKQLKIKLN